MTVGQPRVVTFGEMLLRLSPANRPRLFASTEMRSGFGGAEANVAVSLAHQGLECEYVSRLPENLIGDAALAALRDEGVGVAQIARGPERMGLYFIEPGADVGASRVVYDRAGSAFSAVTPELFDWGAIFRGADWFHVTGITAALGAGPLATLHTSINAARAARVPTSIDLNYRPALWRDRNPLPILSAIVQGVDLVIGNPHSVNAMLGIGATEAEWNSGAGMRDIAERVALACGCRSVALTRREVTGTNENRWGAALLDTVSGEFIRGPARTVEVLDRIGGGDAFAAAFIAASLRGRAAAGVIEYALTSSTLKLRTPGDFNRASTAEIDAFAEQMRASS